MMRSLLVRGMLAGLVAGVLALGFAYAFGEPQVASAIDLEGTLGGGHHHPADAAAEPAEEEPVSRGVQSTLGLATAVGVYGIAIGGLFALAFAFAYGRIGRYDARATAGLLGLGGFGAVVLVPFLKYPANPPAVGVEETVGERTVLYFSMVLLSLAVAAGAVYMGRLLVPRLGNWSAAVVGVLAGIAAISVLQFLLPGINEVPEGFPASLLWRFRLASLGTQVVLWTTLSLAFGALAHRLLAKPSPATVSA